MNFGAFPPVFILSTHLKTEELHEVEDHLCQVGGKLSYQATEARIFLGRIKYKKRAAFDLRAQGVWTNEVTSFPSGSTGVKRRKGDDVSSPLILSDSETESTEAGIDEQEPRTRQKRKREMKTDAAWPDLKDHVMVLRLEWLENCINLNTILSFQSYLVYAGKIVSKPLSTSPVTPITDKITYIKATPCDSPSQSQSQVADGQLQSSSPIFDDLKSVASKSAFIPFHRRKFGQRSPKLIHASRVPKLHRTTTSEFEEASRTNLPSLPAWLSEPHPRPLYSCMRSTPSENPNKSFIAQLTKIKTARLLTLDEIGVRAYSTAIAALSAYPHHIKSSIEITRLPGCDQKIATLWLEWRDSVMPSLTSIHAKNATMPYDDRNSKRKEVTGGDVDYDDNNSSLDQLRMIPIVKELANDKDLKALHLFHDIWGVGPETARKFYYQYGFQDLDDLIEYHWDSLTRVQQIGVKFYDEFQIQIPRDEVESIAKIILQSARRARNIPENYWSKRRILDTTSNAKDDSIHNPDIDTDCRETFIPIWPWQDPQGKHTHLQDFVLVIVGGHRRGKAASGDVDVILSHRDDKMTQDLVVDVVRELEIKGYITHTLTLHTTTSDRGGATLPFRDRGHAGHGFDSLDKALVVWQDPVYFQQEKPNDSAIEDENNNNKNDDDDGKDYKETRRNERTTAETRKKNLNLHRRVDIIVSPWKTIGCAIMGWSGGTTFQRDVRRWVKREKGWKFDSSGVRDRRNGLVLELEDPDPNPGFDSDLDSDSGEVHQTHDDGWEDRERRLMEALGIGWRDPRLRCTG